MVPGPSQRGGRSWLAPPPAVTDAAATLCGRPLKSCSGPMTGSPPAVQRVHGARTRRRTPTNVSKSADSSSEKPTIPFMRVDYGDRYLPFWDDACQNGQACPHFHNVTPRVTRAPSTMETISTASTVPYV
eukprot:5632395-Prymnesium_polylepis.1